MSDQDFYCPQCGYNLRAIPENRCPECGFGYNRAGIESLSKYRGAASFEASREIIVFSAVSALFAGCLLSQRYSPPVIFVVAPIVMVLLYHFTKRSAPRPFDATFFRVFLLFAIAFFVVPMGLMFPTVAACGAVGCNLTAWFLCLWRRRAPDYFDANLAPVVRRDLQRDSVLGLVVLLTSSALTIICLI